MKKILACVLFLGTVVPLSAAAGTITIAQFSGPGIGVIPWGAGAGIAERNIVREENPANEIWRVGNITASVKSDGTISLDAAGLLVASGELIGTNGGNTPFNALLSCEPGGPKYISSNFYMSDASGKLVIRGKLDRDNLPLPRVCAYPVLLIGGVGHGGWVAAANPLP